ncbi:non-ribosomal peptide synthetase [Plantactinospora sp. BC1]|nr:non-ribosomal peptide synthetase [Plantactinospora sp. BC1]
MALQPRPGAGLRRYRRGERHRLERGGRLRGDRAAVDADGGGPGRPERRPLGAGHRQFGARLPPPPHRPARRLAYRPDAAVVLAARRHRGGGRGHPDPAAVAGPDDREEGNVTDVPAQHRSTLADVLRWRSEEQPERLAFAFLGDEPDAEVRWDYRTLDSRARAVAAALRDRCVPGDRALLLHPPGPEYVAALFGCWYAGIVAVPAYPPRAGTRTERLVAIADDARPAVALTTAALGDAVSTNWSGATIATDTLTEPAGEPESGPADGSTAALLQYTSGSTAAPKGVLLSHDNLTANSTHIQRSFASGPESHAVVWLPPYHDMGLIGGLLQPVWAGFPATLMAPTAFLRQPLRWLRAISDTRADCSGGPNFGYEMALRRVRPEQLAELDLSAWRVAFSGAEPVRADTLRRFAEYFAPCGFREDAFYPCYGLAEATLLVTGAPAGRPPVSARFDRDALAEGRAVASTAGTEIVGCGRSMPGQSVRVVDPQTAEAVPDGRVGEIWVSGPSVAQGYWDRPAETARTFAARLAGDPDERSWLRTGDLGFLRDGELFVTGRLKDLVILRGRNHYPQDIEATAQRADPVLRPDCGAAFGVPVDGEERLVVVQEVERGQTVDHAAVTAAIRTRVAAEHDVVPYAVLLTRPATIPRTTSGKVRRERCRELYLAGELVGLAHDVLEPAPDGEVDEPATVTPADLAAADPHTRRRIVTELVRLGAARVARQPAEGFDTARPLVSYGIDSVSAVGLQHRIETATGVPVAVGTLLGGGSADDLVDEVLTGLAAAARPAAEPGTGGGPDGEPTPNQRALWTLQRILPDSTANNLGCAVRVTGTLDVSALHRALRDLVERHDALRTSYPSRSGVPVAVVHEAVDGWFGHVDVTGLSSAALLQRCADEADRPFDLARGPLLRVRLYTGAGDPLLLLAAHHICLDLWSAELLLTELGERYRAALGGQGATDRPPAPPYAGYAARHLRAVTGPGAEPARSYWTRRLAGAPPRTVLPAPGIRPPVRRFRGATRHSDLPGDLVDGLRALAAAEGTTLFTLLLAAYTALIHRYSGASDLVVGTPAGARVRPGDADVVGYVSNLLPLRSTVSGEPSFRTLLGQVRRELLAALERQEYPFAFVADALGGTHDLSHAPVFQTMFAVAAAHPGGDAALAGLVLGIPGQHGRLGPLEVDAVPLPRVATPFELTLTVAETPTGAVASWTYDTDRYDADTVERFAEGYGALLAAVVADPDQPVSRAPLMSAASREWLLSVLTGDRAAGADAGGSVLERLVRVAGSSGDAVALSDDSGVSVTFAEVAELAGRLAGVLRSAGVVRESPVGVCVPRGVDLPVVVLAVWWAGGVYVPLDPSLPAGRLAEMAGAAGVSVLVSGVDGAVPDFTGRVVDVSGGVAGVVGDGVVAPVGPVVGQGAFVVFTSGSTGRPKGVVVEHGQLWNRLVWMWEGFGFGVGEVVCQKTSVGFVDSVWELVGGLLAGVRSVVVSDEVSRDPVRLVEVLARERVTRLLLVPSLLRSILDAVPDLGARLPELRMWVSSGEALPWSLWHRFQTAMPHARLVNLYGSSEAWDTACCTEPGSAPVAASVPIGRPIRGVRVYVLDGVGELVPVGVPGELWVGGAAVSRGYLGEPGLTAERFRPDPFGVVGGRMYRTGDLACVLPDGQVQFLGRVDHQVKVRGVRVEPAEVEAALERHPEVRTSVVVSHPDAAGRDRLVAYVVPAGERRPTVTALRAYLHERLPDAFVPSTFVHLAELPRNASGKVDRPALPPPTGERPHLDGAFVAPRSVVERRLSEIWAEVLGVDRVGVQDNFFDLGGTSLTLVEVHERIVAAFDVDMPVVRLFQNPTIQALVAHLDGGAAEGADRLRRGAEDAARRRRALAGGRARTARAAGTEPQ